MVTNMNVSMRYSTFIPMLMEAMDRTSGDVLKLGAGVFSTPLLHWECEKQNRKLLTIENNLGWFRFTKQYLHNGNHEFLYVNDWDEAKTHIDKQWDVVLVDHSPSERRIEEIKLLANKAKYLVLHDSEPWKERNYGYSQIYPLFKYRFDFDLADHHTTVVSNFHPLDDFWATAPSKMKNLMIYINPADKKFSPEHDDLTKIQIENSLALGWDSKDIVLVTNFDYEHKGVKATVVDDYTVFDQDRSTKIPAINELFKRGLIEDALYWFHDHDAFQLVPFDIELEKDAGFTTHGFNNVWNAGSFFFTKNAAEIFKWIWEYMNLRNTNEQDALTYMWENDIYGINDRTEKINITYNIGIYRIPQNLEQADLPVKVAHFHPHKQRHLNLFRTMLPDRLMKIFSNYGIE